MDKLHGYYTCNGQEFESKIQALMLANITGQPVNWNFNNQVFDRYNWSQEPELTLDQLYDQRAREIREKYDYVVLSYSGGADSNNVLESFLRQNLHIDEIVYNAALVATEKLNVFDPAETAAWNVNAEFKLHTANRLHQIKLRSPGTKITVNDTTNATIEGFEKHPDGEWISTQKEVLNPMGVHNFNYAYFRDLRVMFDKGKKIAIIVALDKPKIRVVDGSCYLYFIDKTANIVTTQDHLKEYPNARTEFFYWHPNSCDMLAKQAHTVLKLINYNPQFKAIFEDTSVKAVRFTQERVLRNMIYTTWKQEWFQADKSLNDWNCEFDDWFIQGHKGTKAHSHWLEGLKYVAKHISKVNPVNPNKFFGIQPILSKFYYIGPVKGQYQSPPSLDKV